MNFDTKTNNRYLIVIFSYYYFVILIVNPTSCQYIYQSLTVMSYKENQFLPVVASAQLISSSFVNSWTLCATTCNTNTFCRIFDYGAIQQNECRLFEGDVNTLGTIIPSSMPNSIVGTIQIIPSLFTQYGQQCSSVCMESRYLTCGSNSTCECMPHTYWNASSGMCLAQSPILGASCSQDMNMCRQDLNYTCLQFYQCGPLSLLSGTTIADNNTVIQGSSIIGLNGPFGLAMYDVESESLIVVDLNNKRLVNLQNINSPYKNITIIFNSWNNGSNLSNPALVFIDIQHANNVYVSDSGYCNVMLFYSMQTINPSPKVVAGVTGICGITSSKLNRPRGIFLDSETNLYIADTSNNRIMRWAPNATSGILIAGQNVAGNNSMSLNSPLGIFIDENSSLLYVADTNNHRIQLFKLNGTPPYNGTTVAGGNEPGSSSHQLYYPRAVWVSSKTGTIYIADTSNNRIQRWNQGATTGVTIAGSPNAIPGTDATNFNTPYNIILNSNETQMYVSDTGNNRIQRFDLI